MVHTKVIISTVATVPQKQLWENSFTNKSEQQCGEVSPHNKNVVGLNLQNEKHNF